MDTESTSEVLTFISLIINYLYLHHNKGPYAIFENPVLHQKIETRFVVSVDGFETLIVYKVLLQ